MTTKDLFDFISNHNSVLNKFNKDTGSIESYSIDSVEMPDINTLYIYGKKKNLRPKYAFIINPIFKYEKKSNGNIDILFNNRKEFSLEAVS